MCQDLKITVVDGLQCPTCGAGELHPADADKPIGEKRWLLRPFKVGDEHGWWSQCLVCSGFYDKDLNEQPEKHDASKGWFL